MHIGEIIIVSISTVLAIIATVLAIKKYSTKAKHHSS